MPALLDDLVAFCDWRDLNPIFHAAIVHARFEEIHPFPDGNGRTGRALVHALWGKHGLAFRHSALPFSTYLAKNKVAYANALNHFHSVPPLAMSPEATTQMLEVFTSAVGAGVMRGTELRKSVAELALTSDEAGPLAGVGPDAVAASRSCDAYMPRAKKRCVLALGHAGPHRSTVPWLS